MQAKFVALVGFETNAGRRDVQRGFLTAAEARAFALGCLAGDRIWFRCEVREGAPNRADTFDGALVWSLDADSGMDPWPDVDDEYVYWCPGDDYTERSDSYSDE